MSGLHDTTGAGDTMVRLDALVGKWARLGRIKSYLRYMCTISAAVLYVGRVHRGGQ